MPSQIISLLGKDKKQQKQTCFFTIYPCCLSNKICKTLHIYGQNQIKLAKTSLRHYTYKAVNISRGRAVVARQAHNLEVASPNLVPATM